MKDSFAEVVEEVKNLSTEEKLELQSLIENTWRKKKGRKFMKTIRVVCKN